MGDVIVLTGPPGAGKSTVAGLLAAHFPLSVHLHADDFWSYIKNGVVPPYLPGSRAQNETVMGVLAGAAFGYAEGGYTVVCDGIVGPWFVDAFRGRTPFHYVILRPDEPTTLARAKARGDGALTASGPILTMHEQFSRPTEYEPHVLDSSTLNAKTTAQAVLDGIEKGRFLLS